MKMQTTLVVILAIIAAAYGADRTSNRIVGGTITTINEYPSMAALLFSKNLQSYSQSCGGTVINQRSVLTAAHCTWGDSANQWRIRVDSTYASSGGTVYNTQQIIMHPQYNRFSYNHDVSILRIASNFVFSNTLQPASIAGPNYNVPDNAAVWAVGWGTTSFQGSLSEQLRHVQVWIVNLNTCAQRYWPSQVNDNMLCSGWLDVGGRDQCQGDSGGPLFHNGVVVGVCSWGNGCAQAKYPGVNARVSKYSSWIQSNA